MLNLREVEAFVAVVESGGFGDAARALRLAQPTVSQRLNRLEKFLGRRLVTRGGGRDCAPTAEGVRFLPKARALLRSAASAVQAAQAVRLVVGSSSNVGLYLFPPLARHFAARRGDGLEMVVGSNLETAHRLENGELDLAVMEWWDQRPGFEASLWKREPLALIVPPRHPWTRLRSVAGPALFGEAWIGGESGTGTGRLLAQAFGPQAADLRLAMTLGSTEGVKAAVKAGLGVSLVLKSAVERELEEGTLCEVAMEQGVLHKDLMTVLPKDSPEGGPARAFVEDLAGL